MKHMQVVSKYGNVGQNILVRLHCAGETDRNKGVKTSDRDNRFVTQIYKLRDFEEIYSKISHILNCSYL